jgi:hypothetical protein
MHLKLKHVFCQILLGLLSFSAVAQKISVRYTPGASKEIFTGNVFLYLSKETRNPKEGSVGIEPFPCFRIAVKNVKPNEAVVFDDAAISYPMPISEIERGEYYVQAVWDKNLGGRSIAESPGNIYNQSIKLHLTKPTKPVI